MGDRLGEEMILYIHGFASSSKSKKVTLLKNRFNDVVAFDLSVEPKRAIQQLEDFIGLHYKRVDITLVGSSLGGYYAMYLSQKYDLKVVLINPAINPDKTLLQYKNKKVENYSKHEVFNFKEHFIEQLKNLRTTSLDNSKVLLLLQTGDQTLDYKEALTFYHSQKVSLNQVVHISLIILKTILT